METGLHPDSVLRLKFIKTCLGKRICPQPISDVRMVNEGILEENSSRWWGTLGKNGFMWKGCTCDLKSCITKPYSPLSGPEKQVTLGHNDGGTRQPGYRPHLWDIQTRSGWCTRFPTCKTSDLPVISHGAVGGRRDQPFLKISV